MTRLSKHLRRLFTAAVIACGPSVVFAAPDDGEPPPVAAQANNDFNMDESNFDQWVFQGSGDAATGRARIDSQLKLKIDELARVCNLTEEQKKKLTLAARGDMKRFFDDVEAVRKKFLAVKNDQNAFQNIWQEIGPLQQKQSAGLFGEASLFGKSLRKTLTDEQQAQYRVVVEERRRFRYRATIDASLVTLSNSVALRSEQHEALLKLLVEETQPPHIFGQYDNYLVLYRLANLPLKKVQPLFDARQWKLLAPQLNQGRSMEAHLAQIGVIDAPKETAGGILNRVRTFQNMFAEGGLDAAVEHDDAVQEFLEAPADALNPERPRQRIQAALEAIDDRPADALKPAQPRKGKTR